MVTIIKYHITYNCAIHKVSEIEIVSSENADRRFNSPMQTDNAISVAMSILKGKINNVSLDNLTGVLYEKPVSAYNAQAPATSERMLRVPSSGFSICLWNVRKGKRIYGNVPEPDKCFQG